jgi:peptidoglycan-associated lipoprotein
MFLEQWKEKSGLKSQPLSKKNKNLEFSGICKKKEFIKDAICKKVIVMYPIIFVFFSLIAHLFAEESAIVPDGKFGPPLNTQNSEYSPVIAPNGRYIVFQSNRPGGMGGMDIWLSENLNYQNRSTGKPKWSNPVNFSELNSSNFEGPFSILFDKSGNPVEIYFTSKKDPLTGREGLDGLNIYVTKNLTRRDPSTDKWSSPEHLIVVNSNFDDKMPAISPDGKSLVFSSNRPGGFGEFDLWVSVRDSFTGTWSNPQNLGNKINTKHNETMPSYHYDGVTLYFSSDRNSEDYRYSIYQADLEDMSLLMAEGEIPENTPDEVPKGNPIFPTIRSVKKLSTPFNLTSDSEGISFTHDGLWAYYASNREGGEGQFDIYRARVSEEMRKPYAFDLRGVVVDGSESVMIGLDSTIQIFSDKGLVKIVTSKRIGGDITSPAEKEPVNFSTKLLTGSTYKVIVSSPGFHPNQFTLDLKGTVGFKKSKYLKIILMPIEEEKDIPKKTVTETQEGDTTTVPPNQVPVNSEKKVILKDFTTKKVIVGGTVTLFQANQRDGSILKSEKEEFPFAEPKEDYEITGSKEGYASETIAIKKDDTSSREKKVYELFLRKKGEYPPIYDVPIYFEFNEYILKPAQKKELNKMVEYLKANKLDMIEVGGHTDNIATKEYNVMLSEKRAIEVKKYFIEMGIEASRIQTRAYWYSIPAMDNKTEEGRAKNRRVTFKKLN